MNCALTQGLFSKNKHWLLLVASSLAVPVRWKSSTQCVCACLKSSGWSLESWRLRFRGQCHPRCFVCLRHTACQPVCTCLCVSSKGPHLVSDREVRCRKGTTSAHSCLTCLPKSTPDGDVVMRDTLRWQAHRWGFLLTHRCGRGFHSAQLLANKARVCWSSCLSHLQPSARCKERSKLLKKKRDLCFCPSNMQAQLGSKRNYRALGKIGQLFVCFVWMLLFCS